MKIGLVCPYDWSYPGGVRSHILGLARALRRKDHDVQIIAPCSGPAPDVLATGRPHPVKFNGSTARIAFGTRARRDLERIFEEHRFDVLHLHEPLIPSISLLATRWDVPKVATFHAASARSLGYALARPWLARRLSTISVRIAVSEAAERLVSRYFPGEHVRIPNGLDVSTFRDAKPDESLLTLKPFVLFVGRPEPRKGLEVAVGASAILRDLQPDVGLVVAGPTAKDVPDWVHALGPVSDERLPGVYAAADVFCAPSLSGESFGIVIAEAMAAGTPVICSDLPGYKEAAAGAALHAPAGDPQRTAELLASVLDEPATSRGLVDAGRARAAQLDWARLCDQVLDTYRRAVSSG